jgi:hypothetical protein
MEKFIMKKQIVAAAVAATMTSVALADISITGSTKVNYTNTQYDDTTKQAVNSVSTEHDLAITGKNGDSTVVIKIATDDSGTITTNKGTSGNFVTEDVYATTKVGDVNIKVGDWDNGDNLYRLSTRTQNAAELSTTIGPVNVTYSSGAGAILDDKVTLKTDLGGVAVKYVDQGKDTELGLGATFAGIKADYYLDDNNAQDTDISVVELSTEMNGVSIAVANITADASATIAGDGWAGDFEDTSGPYNLEAGMDVTAVKLSTSMAGNAVAFTHSEADKDSSSSTDRTFNKLVVTRPLASGATFELTYLSAEEQGVTADTYDKLDLELSVKF